MEQEGTSVDKQQCVNEDKDAALPTTTSPNDIVPGGSAVDITSEPMVNSGSDGRFVEPALLTAGDAASSTTDTTDQSLPQAPLHIADGVVTPPADGPPSTHVATKRPIQPSCDATASTASPPVSLGSDAKVDENLDEMVGLGDNVIVERSPGGRYVRFMEKLGSGASKDVYRAYDTQEGIEVAWNVVNLLGIPKTDRNRIVNEVRLLEQLHHQNIISFHGSWVNRERQEVIFVTEILSSGTLKSFIKKVQVIRWKIAKRWAVQILNGLEYLHSRDPLVIHRDLKCENIFINGASGDLRIGDFGLSTLYRNGKVRSVLGTPEFMAPDMYEETSYDEKVDIYAFGMCLLEIFTKEIPYVECSNPAQIYKKVSAGEPPEVLSRLRSRHAREFVELCLGYKDEATGKYIRPTATELLKHTFLEKRASDDDEVEVEPPLRERGIVEEGESQSTSPPVSGAKSPAQSDCGKITMGTSNCKSQASSSAAANEKESLATSHGRAPSNGSFDDDDDDECDRFEQMPESEINIRNVKVFMGRGQELKEEDQLIITDTHNDDKGVEVGAIIGQHVMAPSSTTSPLTTSCTSLASNTTDLGANGGLSPNVATFPIVAGATTAPAGDSSSPAADIRQFVVTLPLEGQTQNVQFDFHLVNDDPVQVANEMVTELGLPADAAFGIASIITSLASEARGGRIPNPPSPPNDYPSLQHTQQQQQQQQQQQLPAQPLPLNVAPASSQQQSVLPTNLPLVQAENSNLVDANHPQNAPLDPSAVAGFVYAPMQAPLPQQVLQSHAGTVAHVNPLSLSASNYGPPLPTPGHITRTMVNSTVPAVAAQTPMPLQGQPSAVPPHPALPLQQSSTQSVAPVLVGAHFQNPPFIPVPPSVGPPVSLPHNPVQSLTHIPLATQHPPLMHGAPPLGPPVPMQVPMHSHPAQPLPTIQPGNVDLQGNVNTSAFQRTMSSSHLAGVPVSAVSSTPMVANQHYQQVPQSPLLGAALHPSNNIHASGVPPTNLSPMMQSMNGNAVGHSAASWIQPTQPTPLVSPITAPSPDISATQSAAAVLVPPFIPNAPVAAGSDYYTSNRHRTPQVNANTPIRTLDDEKGSILGVDDDCEFLSEDESMMSDELRKLDEDYRKNLTRTKKVFDSRMDNLQRTLVEREVQHLRTLEKHEKDRAAFERRVQQEELEHTRRIEQLQREWDEKRERLARQKQLGGLRSRKPSADGMSLSPASGGVRSHSTSPIYHPDLLGVAAAAATPMSLETMTRPPLSRDSSAPKLD